MYFLDPRIYALLPDGRKPQLAGYLNLVVSQVKGKDETLQPQEWFAERLGVAKRTIQRWEADLARLGLILIEHGRRLNRRALKIGQALLDGLESLKKRVATRVARCTGTDVVTPSDAHRGSARARSESRTSEKAAEGGNGDGYAPRPGHRPENRTPRAAQGAYLVYGSPEWCKRNGYSEAEGAAFRSGS